MSLKKVVLFDGFRPFEADNKPITKFYSQKTKALLAYLLLEAIDRPQTRLHLAGLLWPDFPDSRARRNLSQTLTALRKDLGERAGAESIFLTTTQHVSINPAADLTIDVIEFKKRVTAVHTHPHKDLIRCDDCLIWLEEATGFYTGPLLNQFETGDSNLFENWMSAAREELLQQAISTFNQLAQAYSSRGRLADALLIVDRLIQLAPWQEAAHRLRMLLLAQQGQRIAALNQYEVLCDVLMSELGVSPSAETDDLYDQILAGEIEIPSADTQLEASRAIDEIQATESLSPFQAPSVSPHFVGRQREIDLIDDLLADAGADVTPVALVGMGGIGKTALAAHMSHQFKPRFADGVLWGNPALSNPLDILDVWAQAYGNDFTHLPDIESKATAVRGVLADKNVLIVLDNVDDVASVRPLLPSGDGCQVLLTTRNMEVASALNARHVRMREFSAKSSAKLMIRILGETRLDGPPEQMSDATRISEQLHHLPLAIEIAAQRLRSRPNMPLAALAMRLENTQQRLGLKISDQAVRSSFEVSWEGLPELTQEVFGAIGIFEGRSFAVEALAAVTELDIFDVEDELYSLVALSLVKQDENQRYQQHPLLADFAAEKLTDLSAKQGRFINYYLTFAETNKEMFEALEPEWSNINSAIARAGDAAEWESVLAFTDALKSSWLRYGRYADADRAYSRAETAAKRVGLDSRSAHNYLRWAEIDIEKSSYITASERLKFSESLFMRLEEDDGIAKTFYFQAFVALDQNKFAEAEELILHSWKILKELGDPYEEAKAATLLAYIYFETQDLTRKTIEFAEQALELLESSSQNETAISAFKILAYAHIRDGSLDQAEDFAKQALSLSHQLRKKAEIADALRLLLTINIRRGNYEYAEKQAEECLAQIQRLGNKRYEAMILFRLAQIYFRTDRLLEAKETSQKSMTAYTLVKDRIGFGFVCSLIGEINLKEGERLKAVEQWEKVKQLADELNHQRLKKHVQLLLEHAS